MHAIDLGSFSRRAARKFGDRTFLEFEQVEITFAEFDRRVDRIASALVSLGLQAGDRVAITMRNRPEFLEVMFGCARANLVVVPINRRLAPREMLAICHDAGARVLVTEPDFRGLLDAAATDDTITHQVVVAGEGSDVGPGKLSYAEITRSVEILTDWAPVDSNSPQAIHYTSGTTGGAKGAVRSHGSNYAMMLGSFTRMPARGDDAWLYALPIHSAGLYALALPSIMGGGRLLLTAEFEAGLALDLIERRGVTHMFLVPTMWEMLLRHPSSGSADLSTLRHAFWGGMPMTESLLDRLEQWLPTPCLGLYGMTEATGATYATPETYAAGRRLTSGYPIDTMEVAILGPDGAELPANTPGEVVLRGALCMDEYYGRPDLTAETITAAGWLRSGDLGWLDDDGALMVVDRIKDMIISGGENIYAAEVETVILDLPGVIECAVVGQPDEFWGQSVCAFVVGDADVSPDRVIAHTRQHLAGYKAPRRVVLLPELPKNATGKIEKAELRKSVSVNV